MISIAENETRNLIYGPLRKLATDDDFAQELIDHAYPDVEYLQYQGRNYLLKGQATIVWGYKPTSCNVYGVRHREIFQRLGLKTLLKPEAVGRVKGNNFALKGIKRSYTIAGEVNLYSPRAFAFLGFIYETPATLEFQKELGFPVPISLPTAFRYAGVAGSH